MLLLMITTDFLSITRNFACMIPMGFRNRLTTVKSRLSKAEEFGNPSCFQFFEPHSRTPLQLRNFCENEYDENSILTTTRRFRARARLFSVRSAWCSVANESDSAQKHVEKRTSCCASTRRSAAYSVIMLPFPTIKSTTRPELRAFSDTIGRRTSITLSKIASAGSILAGDSDVRRMQMKQLLPCQP